jgi:glyoxylase-like metal-dependent hydrolase (beta-lactamase superfamily II)
MKIHAIQTGTVAVKTRQVEGVGSGIRRQLNMLLDRDWTEPLPIYAYAIEHPEGVIVVDTGETARVSDPRYFPGWHPYFRFGVREWVEPEAEIGPQLEQLGIGPREVRWVVLTHMHTDHAGGLAHFPHSEILVSRADFREAAGGRGLLRGYPSNRFPQWLDPTLVELASESFGPFPHSRRLTSAGDVTIVALPGHTRGHLGVVVDDGDHSVLLAGDASYTQELMLRGVLDGVSPNDEIAKLTLQRVKAYAAQTPTVYAVAHDPETGARVADRTVVDLGEQASGTAA